MWEKTELGLTTLYCNTYVHRFQIPADKMAAQYALLSREHQGLQKSYQLLASTTAATSSTTEHPSRGASILPSRCCPILLRLCHMLTSIRIMEQLYYSCYTPKALINRSCWFVYHIYVKVMVNGTFHYWNDNECRNAS